jgi:hypothetical protein
MNVAVRTANARDGGAASALDRARRLTANPDLRALAGLFVVFAVLAALSWQKWGVPSVDSGHELTMAEAIAGGLEPYGDIRYFYGPAGVYSLAGAFEVFGTGFTTVFAFGLLQALAILGVFYALCRQLLSALPAFLATTILAAIGFSGTAFNFVLPHTNSATFGILFTLLMLLALCRERLLLAGLAGGVVCLTRPEFAAVAALALGGYLLGRWRQHGLGSAVRALPRLALPAIAVAGTVLGILASEVGAANLFTENLWPVDFLRVTGFGSQSSWAPFALESAVATAARAIVYCSLLGSVLAAASLYSRADGTRERLRAFWPIGASLGALLVIGAAWYASGLFVDARSAVGYEVSHLLIGMSWLPALGFAVAAYALLRLWRGDPPPFSSSWGFDLALIATAVLLGARAYDAFTARVSYAPYYAAPLVLLLALLHQRLAARWPQTRAAAMGALGAVALGLAAYAQVALYPDDDAAVHTARGSFVTTAAAAPALQRTIDYIASHTSPGEPTLDLPADAGLNFMTDRPPALHDVMFLPGLLDSRADEREAIARLKRKGVRYAVISKRRFDGYGFSRFGVDYNRLLASFVERRPPVARFGQGEPAAAGTNPSRSYTIYRIGP